MRAYPSSLSTTPALTDETTLESVIDGLDENLPIEMEGRYTVRELFEILVRAASRTDSIEHTAKTLEGTLSGNGIRYHLDKFDDMSRLEEKLNGALQSRILTRIKHKHHRMAIDLHLIPYYGKPTETEANYIYRSQAKDGTTRFFAYATIYLICRNKRITLGIHAVPCDETLVATVTYLLAMLSNLKVGVKHLCLDRGFYSIPVIRWLKALNIPFIMPAVIRGKQGGTRALLKGRKSYVIPYCLKSATYGEVTCEMQVVCGYHKGIRGQHGIRYLVYVVHRVKVSLRQLPDYYRERFGIETSYRMKNHCRIRTTTKNPILRLLFVALAFILVNLWVYLLWRFVSCRNRGRQVVFQQLFPLKTMLEFLCHAVEQRFPVITAIYLPQLE